MMYIKAWDENSKTMIEDLLALHQRQIVTDFSTIADLDNIKLEYLFPTGAKDINKKESYLGDILKKQASEWLSEKQKEKCEKEKHFLIVKKEKDSNNMYLENNFNIRGYWETKKLPLCRIEEYEIVGNIYENQDMIKKGV